jgi:hypothetical protein
MNILEIIGYILVALGIYRLATTQGSCPGGWSALVIGGLLLWKRPSLNV